MVKKILIEFADPRIKAVEHFPAICKAAEWARLNLLFRYKVRMRDPYVDEVNVFVELDIPDKVGENFKPGNHLRGISQYLLKNHSDLYKPYLVGSRLMYYVEMDEYMDEYDN